MNSHPQKTTMKDLCQTCVSQNLRMSCSNRQETGRRWGSDERCLISDCAIPHKLGWAHA